MPKILSLLNTYEVWTLYNNSIMGHPFHQHVNHAQVISISGGDSAYKTLYIPTTAWKDNAIAPHISNIKILCLSRTLLV